MIRRVGVVALMLVLGGLLAGCVVVPDTVAVFDRTQTSDDTLPAGTSSGLDPSSSRYVGTDSDGDRYWVARTSDRYSSSVCVVYDPSTTAAGDWAVFCGTPPLSATTATGKTIEFAATPATLSSADAELVGDTLLVRDSTPTVSG